MASATTNVPIGTPITTAQAVRGILRLVRSPVLGDVDLDSGPGHTFRRLYDGDRLYDALSSGEQRLVDIAFSVWRGGDKEGASVAAIGGLDPDNRRKVLIGLFYLYLGKDLPWNGIDGANFVELFGEAS